MSRKEEIETEMLKINNLIEEMCTSGIKAHNYNEYWNLKEQASCLKEELEFLSLKKIATDYEIDIYEDENENEQEKKKYRITLHNIPKEIGNVTLTYGKKYKERYGHIAYRIEPEYQGHNYAFKALQLLINEIIKRGLDKPIISAFPNNIPSIKIIEKMGGELLHEAQGLFDWNIYQIDLLKQKTKMKLK